MKSAKAFQLALLHPRYWLTWFGLALLFLLVQLPYPLLNRLGVWMGRTSMRFLKRRVTITRRNLELCFPEMDEAQRDAGGGQLRIARHGPVRNRHGLVLVG